MTSMEPAQEACGAWNQLERQDDQSGQNFNQYPPERDRPDIFPRAVRPNIGRRIDDDAGRAGRRPAAAERPTTPRF